MIADFGLAGKLFLGLAGNEGHVFCGSIAGLLPF